MAISEILLNIWFFGSLGIIVYLIISLDRHIENEEKLLHVVYSMSGMIIKLIADNGYELDEELEKSIDELESTIIKK